MDFPKKLAKQKPKGHKLKRKRENKKPKPTFLTPCLTLNSCSVSAEQGIFSFPYHVNSKTKI